MVDTRNQESAPAKISYHVPCQLKYLALIRQTALEICQRAGFSQSDAHQMEMVVDEACTNVMEHSYGGRCETSEDHGQNTIRVTFLEQDNSIEIEIIDQGTGFDYHFQPVQNPDSYLANQNERGLGMFIIETFADAIYYERGTDRGNVLRLTKRR